MNGCQILAVGMHPPILPVCLEENREAAVCRGLGILLGGWGFLLSEVAFPLGSGRLHKAAHIVAAWGLAGTGWGALVEVSLVVQVDLLSSQLLLLGRC